MSAIVAALFLVPNGTEAAGPEQRRAGPLNVTPYNVYSPGHTTGGQLLHWSGDIGSGSVKLFMERRGNTSSPWARVPDPRTGVQFSITTQADGTFDFDFPAPAMNNPFFRLAGGGAATEEHQFHSVFQDVEVKGFDHGDGRSRRYTLTGDTVLRPQDDRPIFRGRAAALQVRDGSGSGTPFANGTVGGDGQDHELRSPHDAASGIMVYRIRLADWQHERRRRRLVSRRFPSP